jgi:hypothetical protein
MFLSNSRVTGVAQSYSIALDRDTIRRSLTQFSSFWRERIDGWKTNAVTGTERSHAQQYWSDLLKCFGVIPERIDLFERDAGRATTGGAGYIDLFWSGVVIGEAKSLGRDLEAAFDQALDYLAGGSIPDHEFPKYVLVSDFENLRIDRLGDDAWTVQARVEDIADHVDQLMFLAGRETITKQDEVEASIAASGLMADMYNAMLGADADAGVGEDAAVDPEDEDIAVQRTSMWMTRLLFLLYGDDAGLWEEDLFYRFVLYDTTTDNLGTQLTGLFHVLNTPVAKRRRVPHSMARFPYVNGSVFHDTLVPEYFDDEFREALLAACRFHWTRISPAVFGGMFQLVKSKEARRADGEHYTSETNILKLLEPLFLEELRAEADRLIANKSTTQKALRAFLDHLAGMQLVDPACGCGNFLVVAYRELRRIETRIIVELRRREGQATASFDVSFDQKLTIDQFHGFELNWWPAKIAETAMFLVDHQANRELAAAVGDAPERLPITVTAHIRHDNALRLSWETVLPRPKGPTYLFGNPPFLGDHTRTKEQLADLKAAWGGKKTLGRLDFVTGWHAKSLHLLRDRPGEFAYVTTNSITQGDQVDRLFQPIYDGGWRIKFGHRTFAWDSEAPGKAAVHCVIVGFTKDRSARQTLWDYQTPHSPPTQISLKTGINAYLVDGPSVLVGTRTHPLANRLPELAKGSMPTDGGHLVVTDEQIDDARKDPILAKYLRPYIGTDQLLNGKKRWCLWLVDLDPADTPRSTELRQRIAKVKQMRSKSKAPTTREYPHDHLFRQFGFVSNSRFIALPEVSSENRRYLPVGFLEPDCITSNKIYAAEDDGGVLFAIASSTMFITWMKTVGGRMESRLSLSSTITWNNFPCPELDDKARAALVTAGNGVRAARAKHPERTLAEHYNTTAMDPALVGAHEALDRVVDRAFGARRRIGGLEQRQEILFAHYAKLALEQAPAP